MVRIVAGFDAPFALLLQRPRCRAEAAGRDLNEARKLGT
jgi:hypothetical protein